MPIGYSGLDDDEVYDPGFYLDDPLEPEDDYAELRRIASQQFEPQQFRGSFLETFGGLEGLDLPRPKSFGEGFLYGLTGSIGQAGTRAQQRRQQFEEAEQKRRAAFDVERRTATRELSRLTGQERRAREKEKLEEKKRREEREAKTIAATPEMLDDMPWLKRRGVKVGDPVPRDEVFKAPPKPDKTLADIEAEAEARARGGRRGAPPVAGRVPSAVERERLTTDEAAIRQITDLEGLYKKSFVGPAAGRLASLRAAGVPGAGKVDAKQADFMSALAQLRNAVINQLAGATVSAAEAVRMEQQLPNINQPSEVFEANMRQTRKNIERLRNSRLETLEAAGVEVRGGARGRTGARSSQELADVKATALRFVSSGNIQGVLQLIEANPDLDNDPELEAALDAAGVPR